MVDPLTVRRALVCAATICFGGLLLLIFLKMSCSCDLDLYHAYAQTARTQGIAQFYQTQPVEYPPLAIGLILATEELADRLPVPHVLTGFNVYRHPDAAFLRFKLTYRLVMAGCTLITWGLLLLLLRRHFSQETAREWCERLLAFLLCLWPLGYVLLDRLDMGLTCLMLLAVALLLSRLHYVWSIVVLAAAISFKFVPIALVPLWLLITLPGSPRRLGQLLAGGCVRVLTLSGFVVLFTLPFWLMAAETCLGFLAIHKQRGIEFQSNYAAVLTLLKHCGYPVLTVSGEGSAVLRCSVSPLLTQLAAGLVGAGLLAGAGLLFRALARRQPTLIPVAQTDAPLILGHVLWVLLVFLLFNKAFSPQYAVWLLPLAALVPLTGWRRRLFQLGFVGVACLTMLVFPRHFLEVLGRPLPTTPPSLSGATSFGTGLLLARALLLALLTGLLGCELYRRARERVQSPSGC